ncbi:halocin C8-like domain-containing protein [Pasteuria penetrans]|uniref:halocin C8-like domain-containing protein n=1 Tax=Pasteuria penetrans TaxID=86005 RepID=UPI0011EE4E13|nr:halocin C8-like domain-containing protein [Pasteuria penetrans]
MSMGFRRLFSSISVGVLISGLIIPHEQGSAMDSVDDFSSNIGRSSSEGQGSGNSSCKKVDWEGLFEEKEISPEQLPGYDENFHNIVLDRSLKAIRELGVYSYLNERNIEVSDKIEYQDIKFYRTFFKNQEGIPKELKEKLDLSPVFSASYLLRHKYTGERMGYMIRPWIKDDRAIPVVAVIPSEGKKSFYIFREGRTEVFHLDSHGDIWNDKGELIPDSYVDSELTGQVRGRRGIWDRLFSVCSHCNALVGASCAIPGESSCAGVCIKFAARGRIPWVMAILGTGCLGVCSYAFFLGCGEAQYQICTRTGICG